MQINDVELWILEVVAMTGDHGITEAVIEAIAQKFSPDVIPPLETELTLLTERGWLEVKSDITIEDKGATKVERHFITDLGRGEIAAALALRSPS